MKNYNSVADFAGGYDGFILDIWGVIHDGFATYPNVVDCMKKLKAIGKEVVFLSNAPRRADKVKSVLAKFGITEDLYIDAVSSGEAAFQALSTNSHSNYYYIGPEKDRDLLNGLGFKEVENASDAAFAVTTGFDKDDSTLEEKMPQIAEALAAGLKLYCVNPDMIVVRQDGSKMLCAGVIGEYYKEQGGKVEFIGKPFPLVYDFAMKKFSSAIKKERVIAVGDGYETDILGANNYGIDSVLCMGGILSVTKTPLAQLEDKFGCKPTGVIPRFAW